MDEQRVKLMAAAQAVVDHELATHECDHGEAIDRLRKVLSEWRAAHDAAEARIVGLRAECDRMRAVLKEPGGGSTLPDDVLFGGLTAAVTLMRKYRDETVVPLRLSPDTARELRRLAHEMRRLVEIELYAAGAKRVTREES